MVSEHLLTHPSRRSPPVEIASRRRSHPPAEIASKILPSGRSPSVEDLLPAIEDRVADPSSFHPSTCRDLPDPPPCRDLPDPPPPPPRSSRSCRSRSRSARCNRVLSLHRQIRSINGFFCLVLLM